MNLILFCILAILFVALIIQNQVILSKTRQETDSLAQKVEISEDYVIQILDHENYLQGKKPVQIMRISPEELDQLIDKSPAIYDENMGGMFDVKYEDYWIIYDPINEKIVKKIRTQGIKIE